MLNQDTQIERANEAAEAAGDTAWQAARTEALAIGGEAERLYLDIAKAGHEAGKQSKAAQEFAAALVDRSELHSPKGDQQLTEQLSTARLTMKARLAAAEDGIAILKNVLLSDALPKLGAGSEGDRAIEEVRMRLEGATNDLAARMSRLAQGPDRMLAAVVTGSWGLSRLGGDAEAHRGLQLQALGAARQHGSTTEKTAAVAYTRLTSNLSKALSVSSALARQRAGG
jgi:hypothetical protein